MKKSQYLLERRIPPVVQGLLAAASMWFLAKVFPAWTIPLPGRSGLALVLVAIALMIALAGVLAFRRVRTTVNPLRPETAAHLVTEGIYARTRNPMYLAIALALVGWACWLASPLSLLMVPLFVAYLTRFQILPEERALEAKFGEDFRGYCARVGRWW